MFYKTQDDTICCILWSNPDNSHYHLRISTGQVLFLSLLLRKTYEANIFSDCVVLWKI